MFKFSTEKELFCKVEGSGCIYAKKGSMVAYTGHFDFEKSLLGPNGGGGTLGALVGFAKRSMFQENYEMMTAKGSGALFLAQNAYHIEIFDLEPNDYISVESENILAFPDDIKSDVRFIGKGVLCSKGLFTTVLENNTRETKQVALITDGNAIFMETPCVADPDAVVAWTGPDPKIEIAKLSWKTYVGQTSGESYHFNFTKPGEYVLIQPSENLSGINIGID